MSSTRTRWGSKDGWQSGLPDKYYHSSLHGQPRPLWRGLILQEPTEEELGPRERSFAYCRQHRQSCWQTMLLKTRNHNVCHTCVRTSPVRLIVAIVHHDFEQVWATDQQSFFIHRSLMLPNKVRHVVNRLNHHELGTTSPNTWRTS